MKKRLFILTFFGLALNVFSQEKATTDTLKLIELDEFIIQGKENKRYNPKNISNSLRIVGELSDISQNIQVIDASLLQNQSALNITEGVTRNVSGTFREELHNGISSDIYTRGGYINPQRNGVDLRPITKGPLSDDVATIEAIEFVKGPSSFLTSMGDPSGSYNIITKKPTGNNRKIFLLTQGAYGVLRGEADLEGQIDGNDNFLYRVNLAGMHNNSFIRFDYNDRIVVAPSLLYKFDNTSSLTVEYIYERVIFQNLSQAQISPYGYATLPINFTMTDPSTRPYKAKNNSIYTNYKKAFNSNWLWTTQLANINVESVGTMYWVYGRNEEDIDILDRYLVYDAMKYNTFSAQSFLHGMFKTGEIKHSLLAGADFNLKHNTLHDTWETASTIYPLSLSNPEYAPVVNNNGQGGNWGSENNIDGEINKSSGRLYYASPYMVDEIMLMNERLRINAGVRATRSIARFNEYGDVNKNNDWAWNPRAGANFRVVESFNLYGLYDTSFLPQIGKTENERPLKPVRGTSFEIGIKKQWNHNAFSTTFSVYHIKRSNTLVNDPFTNTYYQSGENVSKGVEFDIRGRILPGVYLIANYAYTDSKITKDEFNPELVGVATPNRVKHLQNTWLEFEVPGKIFEGLTLSTGYQMLLDRQERFINLNDEKLKNLFRTDAGASYTKSKYTFRLMVNNVFNKHQYSTGWKKNDMYYWVQLTPITYRLSLSMTL